MEGNLQPFELKRQPPPLPTPDRPTSKAEKRLSNAPPSDRAEYHEVEMRPRSRRVLNVHKPKVIISPEAQTTSDAIKWERARAGAEQEHTEMMRTGENAAIERLRFGAEKEREWADRIIKQFENRLRDARRPLTEDEMEGFAEKFSTCQKELERFQEEARFLPRAKAGPNDARVLTDANYEVIRRLENAIHASKFPRQQALGELLHGKVTSFELETEEAGKEAEEVADTISAKIEAEYGASPEDLILGKGSFWKGVKFRLKNSLARITGQESDFAKWQRAERDKQSAELAKLERLPHERKRRFTAEEKQRQEKISLAQRLEAEKSAVAAAEAKSAEDREWKQQLADEVAEQNPSKTMEVQPEDIDIELVEARKSVDNTPEIEVTVPTAEKPKTRTRSRKTEWEAKNIANREAAKKEAASAQMTVEKAAKLVPYSAAMWDNVKTHFEEHPDAAAALPMEVWPNPKEHPITNYVLLVAKYIEAEKDGDQESAKRTYDILKKFADALRIPEQEMLTLTKKQKRSEMVVGKGMVARAKRSGEVARQEARWKS